MKEVKIVAITEKGKEALETHLRESVKLRWDQKHMFRLLGFSQTVETREPFTLSLSISNSRLKHHIRPDHFTQVIEEALEKNGAKKDIDYSVTVIP